MKSLLFILALTTLTCSAYILPLNWTPRSSNGGAVITYSVIYDGNTADSGLVTDEVSPYAESDTVTVLANGFTKSGYDFVKWDTAADGSGTEYAANDTFAMPTADVVLYAQWAEAMPDPIGWWKLDNTWDDESENGNTITNSGASFTTDRFDGTHAVLEASGSSSYISIPESALFDFGASDFTVSMWWKRPVAAWPLGLFSGYTDYWFCIRYCSDNIFDPGVPVISIAASSNGTSWDILDPFTTGAGAIVPLPGTWHHVVIVRNGSNWKSYIDNVLDINVTAAGTLVSMSGTRTIGRMGTGPVYKYGDVSFDDVRIYDVALTADQISAMYTTYAVTYSGNGNTGGTAPAAQVKYPGINITLRTNSGSLVKSGKFFDGWNTAADGSGTDYAVGASYTTDAALPLYAKWVDAIYFCVSGFTDTTFNGSYGSSGEFNGKFVYTNANGKNLFYSYSSMQTTYSWVIDVTVSDKMFPMMAKAAQTSQSGATPTTYAWSCMGEGTTPTVVSGACQ